MNTACFDELPIELLKTIFALLGFGDRLRCQTLCRRFRQALNNDSSVWRVLTIKLPRVSDRMREPRWMPTSSERQRQLGYVLYPKMAKMQELCIESNVRALHSDATRRQFRRLGGEAARVALHCSVSLRRLDVTAALGGSGLKLARVLMQLPRLQHLQWHLGNDQELPALPSKHSALASLHVGVGGADSPVWALPPALASRLTRLVALGWRPSDGAWAALGSGALRELRLLVPALYAPPQLSALTSLRSLAVAARLDGYTSKSDDDASDFPNGITALTLLTRLEVGWASDNIPVDQQPEICVESDVVIKAFDVLERLPNLRHLALRHSRLYKVPDAIEHLTNLTQLCLANNEVYMLPAWLGQLPRLEVVDAGESSLPFVEIEARLALAPRLREVRVGAHSCGGGIVSTYFNAEVLALGDRHTDSWLEANFRIDLSCAEMFDTVPQCHYNKWQLLLGSSNWRQRGCSAGAVKFAEAALRGMREHGDVLARLEGLLRYSGSLCPNSYASRSADGESDGEYPDDEGSDA